MKCSVEKLPHPAQAYILSQQRLVKTYVAFYFYLKQLLDFDTVDECLFDLI